MDSHVHVTVTKMKAGRRQYPEGGRPSLTYRTDQQVKRNTRLLNGLPVSPVDPDCDDRVRTNPDSGRLPRLDLDHLIEATTRQDHRRAHDSADTLDIYSVGGL